MVAGDNGVEELNSKHWKITYSGQENWQEMKRVQQDEKRDGQANMQMAQQDEDQRNPYQHLIPIIHQCRCILTIRR